MTFNFKTLMNKLVPDCKFKDMKYFLAQLYLTFHAFADFMIIKKHIKTILNNSLMSDDLKKIPQN